MLVPPAGSTQLGWRGCACDLHPQWHPCMLHGETFELQGSQGLFVVALLVVKAWTRPCIRGWESRVKSGPSTQRRASSVGNRPQLVTAPGSGSEAEHSGEQGKPTRSRLHPANTMFVRLKNKPKASCST